jgi:hypothetical protein
MVSISENETCWVCERFARNRPVFASDLAEVRDLALCTLHWNWWVIRYLGSADEPPCAAHLIAEQR